MRPTRKNRSPTPALRRGRKRKSTEASSPETVYLGLGSNLGERGDRLTAALTEIARRARLLRVSSVYRTEPVGYADQRDFWNAVAKIRWQGSARALLSMLARVERKIGRTPTFRNGPREIDIDILDFGGMVHAKGAPLLPHPRLAQRRFVLAPLAELEPRWKHPVTGETAAQLLARLPRRPSARKLGPISLPRPGGPAARLPCKIKYHIKRLI